MKLLIVHDREEVAQELKTACSAEVECSIDIAVDAVSAQERLRATHYDLMVIDLTIPYRFGGLCEYQNAANLLEDIKIDDKIFPPGDVIALSREPPAIAAIERLVARETATFVVEDVDGIWKSKILDKVYYIGRSAKGRRLAAARHHDADVLIVCAMDEEFEPIREAFELSSETLFPNVYRFVFNDKNGTTRVGIACSVGKQGQTAAASLSQNLISWYRPKLALMVGICGGVDGKTQMCDVILFETVFDWDSGKYRASTNGEVPSPLWLAARPEPISIRTSRSHVVSRRLQMQSVKDRSRIEQTVKGMTGGTIDRLVISLCHAASGGSVVADQNVMNKVLLIDDKISALDMEAYGFYSAASSTFVVKPEYLCIKGVSDHCNATKADEFHKPAAYLSVAVAKSIILDEWDFQHS